MFLEPPNELVNNFQVYYLSDITKINTRENTTTFVN